MWREPNAPRYGLVVWRGLAEESGLLDCKFEALCDFEQVLEKSGAWLSLVERLVRDQEVASSNLVAPTSCKCGWILHCTSKNTSLRQIGPRELLRSSRNRDQRNVVLVDELAKRIERID